jgi:polyphosphate glucokinase
MPTGTGGSKNLIACLHTVFAYDHLYLGGGNSRCVSFKLPRNVSLVSNDAGWKACFRLDSLCEMSLEPITSC